MITKKYLLFAGGYYYPNGGWSDFQGNFKTPLEAALSLNRLHYGWHDWCHLIDSDTHEYVEGFQDLVEQLKETQK